MHLLKLFICIIVIIILLKLLLKRINNIKYIIKEKNKRQEEKIKKEQIKQEELKQERVKQYAQRQEKLKRQEEFREQEESRRQAESREQEESRRQAELKRQEEFRKKFPEIAKYREETQRQKELLEIEEARRRQYAQWQEDLKQGKIKMHYETQEEKELYLEKQRAYLYGTADKLTMNSSPSYSKYSMSYVDKLDNGYEFEEYIAETLKKLGYTKVEVTSGSGDNGADILAEKDDITFAFQCKWSSLGNNNIGNKAVQEIYSGKAIYKKDKRNSCNKFLFYSTSKELSKRPRRYIMG